jgi:hypothetical protein
MDRTYTYLEAEIYQQLPPNLFIRFNMLSPLHLGLGSASSLNNNTAICFKLINITTHVP